MDTPEKNNKPLKDYTAARIGMGVVGSSIPLSDLLAFKLAHAHARDAVFSKLAFEELAVDLKKYNLQVLHLQSQADDRHSYLKRPDKGRKINNEYFSILQDFAPADIAIIIVDGLSAKAVNEQTMPLLDLLIPKLTAIGLTFSPICLVEQGRVAIGDDIAYALNARLSLLLIGERPGLSAADSMGTYLTYGPRPGLTDEMRNCVSNIRPEGLNFPQAADKIFYLIQEAFKRKLTGVNLKDNAGLLGINCP